MRAIWVCENCGASRSMPEVATYAVSRFCGCYAMMTPVNDAARAFDEYEGRLLRLRTIEWNIGKVMDRDHQAFWPKAVR